MIGRDTNCHPHYYVKLRMAFAFNRLVGKCGNSLYSVRTHGRIGRDKTIRNDTKKIIPLLTPMLGSSPNQTINLRSVNYGWSFYFGGKEYDI